MRAQSSSALLKTLCLAGAATAVFAAGASAQPVVTPQYLPITATATIAGQKIALEVADTPEKRRTGMIGRPQLPPNRGMLFVFDPPEPATFWTKGINHPLDLVFIYKDRVRKIEPSAPPCENEICPIYSRGADPVQYVLELRAGAAKLLGIKKGSKVKIEFKDPA